jgi:hypothetical protein
MSHYIGGQDPVHIEQLETNTTLAWTAKLPTRCIFYFGTTPTANLSGASPDQTVIGTEKIPGYLKIGSSDPEAPYGSDILCVF